jgi:hypothetical protein
MTTGIKPTRSIILSGLNKLNTFPYRLGAVPKMRLGELGRDGMGMAKQRMD